MKNDTTIGIDIAKNVMQFYKLGSHGEEILSKRLKRGQFLSFMANQPTCLVGMEACGGSNYWAKELQQLGFEVKLMSPNKVKKYTDSQKNDKRDAKACAEAVRRADMNFVEIKTSEQRELQMLHRVRKHYIKERTSMMNMIRGLLMDEGIVAPQGQASLRRKLIALQDTTDYHLSIEMKSLIQDSYDGLLGLNELIKKYSNKIEAIARADERCQLLETLPGVGKLSSTAVIAKIGNGHQFKNGREHAAFLGLVPRQCSSGNKIQLHGITKHGDRYIRTLLIHGGRACVKAANRRDKVSGDYIHQNAHYQWVRDLVARVGKNKASVAVANKNARMMIALLKSHSVFDATLAH